MSFIETQSGRMVNLLDPNPDTIVIEDIAWALSNLCRYNGHCYKFYSVAEHSLEASTFVEDYLALATLLHDASEAYLGDVATPLKKLLPEYRKIEDNMLEVIMKKFGCYEAYTDGYDKIKQADMAMLDLEAACMLPSGGKYWPCFENFDRSGSGYTPLGLSPGQAYTYFMLGFNEFYKG